VVCTVQWTPTGQAYRYYVEYIPCDQLVSLAQLLSPPVRITEGEACSTLLADLMPASFMGFPISDALQNTSSCPSGLNVTGNVTAAASAASAPEQLQQALEAAQAPFILPFHLEFNKTATQCMPAPEMDYHSDIGITNGGWLDSWNVARDPGFGMAYFTREDLPFYYALADSFTIGDQYFQSTFTATNPNRLHLFSGSNGLSVPNSGYSMLDDSEPLPGFNWETMAETLMKSNVSWRVLQELDSECCCPVVVAAAVAVVAVLLSSQLLSHVAARCAVRVVTLR
jgi:hypothetical protein